MAHESHTHPAVGMLRLGSCLASPFWHRGGGGGGGGRQWDPLLLFSVVLSLFSFFTHTHTHTHTEFSIKMMVMFFVVIGMTLTETSVRSERERKKGREREQQWDPFHFPPSHCVHLNCIWHSMDMLLLLLQGVQFWMDE